MRYAPRRRYLADLDLLASLPHLRSCLTCMTTRLRNHHEFQAAGVGVWRPPLSPGGDGGSRRPFARASGIPTLPAARSAILTRDAMMPSPRSRRVSFARTPSEEKLVVIGEHVRGMALLSVLAPPAALLAGSLWRAPGRALDRRRPWIGAGECRERARRRRLPTACRHPPTARRLLAAVAPSELGPHLPYPIRNVIQGMLYAIAALAHLLLSRGGLRRLLWGAGARGQGPAGAHAQGGWCAARMPACMRGGCVLPTHNSCVLRPPAGANRLHRHASVPIPGTPPMLDANVGEKPYGGMRGARQTGG